MGQADLSALRVLAVIEASSLTGPAKNLLAVARAMSLTGAGRIRILVLARRQRSNAFTDACAAAGVEAEVIPERFRFDWRIMPQLAGAVRRYRPDILQSHTLKSHFLIRLCGLGRRVPWIAFNHGYTAEDWKMRLYNQLDRWSLRAPLRVVTVCGAFASRLEQTGVRRERIVVRHNAVDAPVEAASGDVPALRRALGIPDEAKVVLSIGRLSREKAHADLIRAAAGLRARGGVPPFRLVMVGAGGERARLGELCRSLAVEDTVLWAGTTGNTVPYYALADLFVLPSHSEGSPNVVLEAMAAGLPVLATAVGGVPELIEDGATGLLVPAQDVPALSRGMAELLASPGLCRRLGDSARDRVRQRHSREEYVASMVALYREVLGLPRRAVAGA